MSDPFVTLEKELKEIFAQNDMAETGTKGSGYSEEGPFNCQHCIHYDDPDKCDHTKVIADPAVKKTEDGTHGIVKAEACCRYFSPVVGDNDGNNDGDDDADDK